MKDYKESRDKWKRRAKKAIRIIDKLLRQRANLRRRLEGRNEDIEILTNHLRFVLQCRESADAAAAYATITNNFRYAKMRGVISKECMRVDEEGRVDEDT